jgi:hypothetical protein
MELKRSGDTPLLTLLRSLFQQFWDDNQGPVVMVWDGMLPGEEESAKRIITDENDWIIWGVKPP